MSLGRRGHAVSISVASLRSSATPSGGWTPSFRAWPPEPRRGDAGLAAAVVPLAYLADRFLYAARPGVAVPGKHVISGDGIEAGQRFDRLGGVRGERRDLGAAHPRGHRVGGECVADEQGAERFG